MTTPPPSWEDVAWMREQWAQIGGGPFMLKGVCRIDDARRAVDAGVTAISVSNHGGNNLDGTPAAVRMVKPISDAVGDRIEVLLDGGIRRGSDVVKALALGARAVLIGRADGEVVAVYRPQRYATLLHDAVSELLHHADDAPRVLDRLRHVLADLFGAHLRHREAGDHAQDRRDHEALRDARQAVGDVLDLDIEGRGVQEIEPAPTVLGSHLANRPIRQPHTAARNNHRPAEKGFHMSVEPLSLCRCAV